MEQIVLILLATLGITFDEAQAAYKCPLGDAAIACIYDGLKKDHTSLLTEMEYEREAEIRAEDFAG